MRIVFVLVIVFNVAFYAHAQLSDLSVHSISVNSQSTITGSMTDSNGGASFSISTNSGTQGYASSNIPTASLSNGSGAGYNGISLKYFKEQQCSDSYYSGCHYSSVDADLGNDVIDVSYSVNNVSDGLVPQIVISQSLRNTSGNNEASSWQFTWTGGGTAQWYDQAVAEDELYRFVNSGSHNPANSELKNYTWAYQSGWNTSYREIVGSSNSGSISSGGTLNFYATNNSKTKWYIVFPEGVTSVTVHKVTNANATGARTGIGTRYPVLGYGDSSSANLQPACSSEFSVCTNSSVYQIFQNGASFNEWVSFGTNLLLDAPDFETGTNYNDSSNTYTIPCGSTTANLQSLVAENLPSNSTVTWHSSNVPSSSNLITNTSAVGVGTYYASFYNASNQEYSINTTTISVTQETNCCDAGSIAPWTN